MERWQKTKVDAGEMVRWNGGCAERVPLEDCRMRDVGALVESRNGEDSKNRKQRTKAKFSAKTFLSRSGISDRLIRRTQRLDRSSFDSTASLLSCFISHMKYVITTR